MAQSAQEHICAGMPAVSLRLAASRLSVAGWAEVVTVAWWIWWPSAAAGPEGPSVAVVTTAAAECPLWVPVITCMPKIPAIMASRPTSRAARRRNAAAGFADKAVMTFLLL